MLPVADIASPAPAEPIAIVGSACRFPGSASSPAKLWDLLRQPRDILCEISTTRNRFNQEAFYHPSGVYHGTSNVKSSYLLDEDPRLFDASFFSIKPVEANVMDPQQRFLLETVYEALEAGGLTINELGGSQTAVYVGQMWSDYEVHVNRDVDALPTYTGTGTARSILSNRLSHFFDWHGPSVTLDTACSSSLVAVYDAVSALRSTFPSRHEPGRDTNSRWYRSDGDATMAVAAGANMILTPEPYIGMSNLKMISAESRSRMWDAKAQGYARGEGVAALVLKKLSDAIRDGDHIESVIREVGVNQDGRTKDGITMPSQHAQRALIERTYAKAGLDPKKEKDRCQFFEAHGTGTQAGDPKVRMWCPIICQTTAAVTAILFTHSWLPYRRRKPSPAPFLATPLRIQTRATCCTSAPSRPSSGTPREPPALQASCGRRWRSSVPLSPRICSSRN